MRLPIRRCGAATRAVRDLLDVRVRLDAQTGRRAIADCCGDCWHKKERISPLKRVVAPLEVPLTLLLYSVSDGGCPCAAALRLVTGLVLAESLVQAKAETPHPSWAMDRT